MMARIWSDETERRSFFARLRNGADKGKEAIATPLDRIDAALDVPGNLYVGERADYHMRQQVEFYAVWPNVPTLFPDTLPPDCAGLFKDRLVFIDATLPPNALEVRDADGRTVLVTTIGEA